MRQLKEKSNLLVLLLTIFSLSFCTALDEATTTEDSASAAGTGSTSTLSADCTAASATSVYSVFSDIDGAQDVNADAGWYPTFDGSDTSVALDDGTGPKCGNVSAKITRATTSGGWLAGGVALTADWSSYDTLKIWVKADSSAYSANGFKLKLSDSAADTSEVSVDDFGFTADGNWQLVKIPLAAFSVCLDKSTIDNFIWVGNNLTSSQVVYFDEAYADASGESTGASGASFGSCTTPTSAPAAPTTGAGSVTSIYSDTYTDVSLSGFPTGWSNAGLENVDLSGNQVKKMSGGNFIGIEPSSTINASSYTKLHMDVFVPSGTSILIKVRDYGANGSYDGGDDAEVSYTHTLSGTGAWESVDITLTNATKAAIGQLVIDTANSNNLIFFDNIYFY